MRSIGDYSSGLYGLYPKKQNSDALTPDRKLKIS